MNVVSIYTCLEWQTINSVCFIPEYHVETNWGSFFLLARNTLKPNCWIAAFQFIYARWKTPNRTIAYCQLRKHMAGEADEEDMPTKSVKIESAAKRLSKSKHVGRRYLGPIMSST